MVRFSNPAAQIVAGLLALTGGLNPAAARPETPATQPVESDRNAPTSVSAARAPGDEQGPAWRLLGLEELTAELGFEASYDRRRFRIDAADAFRLDYHQTNRAQRLEETVGLRGSGTLFDERILHFDLSGRWGLSQERFSESRPGPDLHEDPHGDLLEYDAVLELLPRGRLSATGFATRSDVRVPRAFQPSLDRSLERFGGELRFSDPKLPMRLSFEHVQEDLTSRTRRLNDDERRGTDTLRYEATWQISEQQSLRLDYEYEDRRERYSGDPVRFDTVRNYLTLDHALRFGRQQRSSWETLARFQDETGDLARDAAEVSTRLRLEHSDRLASHFSAQYLRESFVDLKTDTWRGEAGLTHRLGDRLTSVLSLYGLRQHADENADFSEWGGLVSSSYSQPNRWGRFSANLSYNRAATDFSDGDRRGLVLSEAVTFRDPLNAYLSRTEIDPFSIVVTDASRARVYLAGRDYVVLRFGPYTALRRVATGRIADRQTVFVSYTYRVRVDRQIQRDRLDVRLQQDFDFGLTPYYAGSFQFEDVDYAQRSPFRERDINRHRLGATYRRQRWSAGLEFEYNEDTTDPFQAAHLHADAVLWQTAAAQIDGRMRLSHFWFRGIDFLPRRDALVLDAGASMRWLVRRGLEATATALYRYEDDTSFGITQGVDLTAGVQWRIGLLALSLELEYDVLRLPNSRDDGLAVWLKLKRDIPILTGDTP